MNDLMSFGVHRCVEALVRGNLGVRAGDAVLILPRHGDITALLLRRLGASGNVVPATSRSEAAQRPRSMLMWICTQFALCAAQCRGTTVSKRQFDAVTIAFGLRNVTTSSARWLRCIEYSAGWACMILDSRR